jgi:hypothetical protein
MRCGVVSCSVVADRGWSVGWGLEAFGFEVLVVGGCGSVFCPQMQ